LGKRGIMKQRAVLIMLLFGFAVVIAYGQAPTKVGADKCKLCHKVEFASWQKTKHATAKVECEDCHGPGSNYKTMAIMKDKAKAKAAGLIEPTEKDCKACHEKKNVKIENYADAIKKVHDKKPIA
jgi:formate-dependent nitrite reductase cytochrome c552 subunit